MQIHANCWVLLLCAFDVVFVSYSKAQNAKFHPTNNNRDLPCRAKRAAVHMSLAARGLAALKTLCSGSKPLTTMSTTYRKYEKHGNFEDALKDFYSVQPRRIKIRQKDSSHADYEGTVGDRLLLLKEKNYFGLTTLDIIDNGLKADTRIDRIIYKVR